MIHRYFIIFLTPHSNEIRGVSGCKRGSPLIIMLYKIKGKIKGLRLSSL